MMTMMDFVGYGNAIDCARACFFEHTISEQEHASDTIFDFSVEGENMI